MRRFFASLFGQVVAALVLGIVLGIALPDFAVALKPLGDGFIKLIKMAIAPLVFGVVVHGIVGAGDLRKVGRVGLKALIYFEAVTTLALVLGIVLAYVFAPGAGMNIDPSTLDAKAIASYTDRVGQVTGTVDFLMKIIPTTIVDAFAKGDILQVLIIAILFGSGLALLGEHGQPLAQSIERITAVLFKIIGFIVRLAPLGVLGAVAFTVGKYGIGSLRQLGMLVALFYVGVAFFVFVVLGAILRAAGFSILKLMAYLREELMVVAGTASSDSVLPQIMRKLERLGIRDSTVGLVIPHGLLVQPRRLFPLPHPRHRLHRAGHQHAPVLRTPDADPRHRPPDLQGRTRRPRIGHRRPGGDPVGGAGNPGDRAGAGSVHRLVRRHRPGARQPHRQLRGDGGHRRLGGRYRSGSGPIAS